MKRIFISHSNSDHESDTFLRALCTRLREAGMDVLIDNERLRPGSVWRQEIYAWMSTCNAAIVMLSRAALDTESVWVPRETSLLMWRRALDPKLTVIPVLCEGVVLEDVEQDRRFRDLQIRELQAEVLADPDDALTRLLDGLAHLSPVQPTPLDELIDFISPLLRGFAEDDLEQALERVPVDISAYRTLGALPRRLAFAFLSCELNDIRAAFDFLYARAPGSAQGDLATVITILAANWVDIEAAQWIARESAARIADQPAKAIVLNATSMFAAEMYVQRASSRVPRMRWPLVPVTGVTGQASVPEMLDEIEHALMTELPLPPDPFQTDELARRRRQLQTMKQMHIPIFIVMRLPPDADALLSAAAVRYPELNFFFLTGQDPPPAETCPPERFRSLKPKLDPETEMNAQALMDVYRTAYQIH